MLENNLTINVARINDGNGYTNGILLGTYNGPEPEFTGWLKFLQFQNNQNTIFLFPKKTSFKFVQPAQVLYFSKCDCLELNIINNGKTELETAYDFEAVNYGSVQLQSIFIDDESYIWGFSHEIYEMVDGKPKFKTQGSYKTRPDIYLGQSKIYKNKLIQRNVL